MTPCRFRAIAVLVICSAGAPAGPTHGLDSPASAPSTTPLRRATSRPVAISSLLDLLPDDVFAAAVIDRPRRVVPRKLAAGLADALAPTPASARALLEAVRHAPGPVLVAMLHAPLGDRFPTVVAAIPWTDRPDRFDDYVQKRLVPALSLLVEARGQPPVSLQRHGELRELVAGRRRWLTYCFHSGFVLASTDPDVVRRRLRGEFPAAKLARGAPLRSVLTEQPAVSGLRIALNTEQLWERLPVPDDKSLAFVVRQLLHPQDVRAAAVELSADDDNVRLSCSVALADECRGLARLLADGPAPPSRVLDTLPADYDAVGRVAFSSIGDLIDRTFALTDVIDPRISAEYRAEAAEFHGETGVDPAALLRQFVGEIVVALRFDMTRSPPFAWGAVAPLADAAAVEEAFNRLIDAFDLPVSASGPGDQRTYVAAGASVGSRFAYAIRDGRWTLADSSDSLAEFLDAANADQRPNARIAAAMSAAPPGTRLALVVDLGAMATKVPIALAAAQIGPEFMSLVGRSSISLSLSASPRSGRLDLVVHLDRPDDATGADSDAQTLLATGVERVIVPSLVHARRQARQQVCLANLRGIGMALHIHASQHKGDFTASMSELLTAGLVNAEQFADPRLDQPPPAPDRVDQDAGFLYRPGLSLASAPGEVLVVTRSLAEDAACVLFVDGHVEVVAGPSAQALIDLVNEGAVSVTIERPWRPTDNAPR